MSFEYLGLSDEVLAAVSEAGYVDPTPVQKGAIPFILQGRDVLAIAQTGTGKTASFTLPMIDILAQGRARARMPRTLILEPTRELAAQVAESFEKYGKHHKLTMALLIGGVSFADQFKLLDRGVDVLIATPGRLLDHFERGKLMLTGVEILVVDEADRMLDMGFIPDVERICKLMPQRPQTLFFSATMPPEIKRLTDQFLKDPRVIEVARPATAAETVEQAVIKVSPRDKRKALRTILRAEDVKNALIFCNRKRDVKAIYSALKKDGFNVAQLHGDMPQSERMAVLASFKEGEVTILAASDVAARGLDIPLVSHVVNFDAPMQADDYVHRIGRTGRAGRKGKAFMIVTPEDNKFLSAIEKLTGVKIPVVALGGVGAPSEVKSGGDKTDEDEPAAEARGRGRGGRGRDRDERKERADTDKASKARTAEPSADKSLPPAKSAKPEKKEQPEQKEEPEKKEKQEQRKGRKEREGPVVGWGDSMPAFMKTPARPAGKKA